MPTEHFFEASPAKRILGRVAPENFIGRTDQLREITALALSTSRRRGLLIHAAPAAGASELLRQAYDKLFQQHGGMSPIYFAFARQEQTVTTVARRFLHTFLSQFIAHRRHDASFVNAPPALRDLIDLADPADYQWVDRLVTTFERARDNNDDLGLVRLCFSAPVLAASRGARSVVMIDEIQNIEKLRGEIELGNEIAQVSMHGDVPFVLCGLRRGLLDELSGGNAPHRFDGFGTIHLENLREADARTLVERLAHTERIALNDETRDLIVQLFNGSPFYIASFMHAAHRDNVSLQSFLECQKVYVNEILGGRINRRFNSILEELTPTVTTRRSLVRLLHEAAINAGGKPPVEAWRRGLELEPDELYPLMFALHVRELASFNATFMEIGTESLWRDYLRASYRLQVAAEPRALVVADTLVETLKRAPQTMARHYRRATALGLRELLAQFDEQQVPASLLHYDRFSRLYHGIAPEENEPGLAAETDLIRLPQIVHAASCASFHPPMRIVCDEERCAVGHGFDAMPYTDSNEVVWLTAEIDSKLEAGRAVTEVWCERLTQVSYSCGFKRYKIWLVAPAGFSAEASELLNERGAFSSNRQQLELLTSRLTLEATNGSEGAAAAADKPDEFEMVIPMGGDTELIAAHTVEQIARRLNFRPEAINQIKTALIEACINASEHSHSPDRKIYQRFRLESDKLVVTISSRGINVPSPTNAEINGSEGREENNGRRGWGLRLIRTLMDEVEFERVDDGTCLRMTKYLHR